MKATTRFVTGLVILVLMQSLSASPISSKSGKTGLLSLKTSDAMHVSGVAPSAQLELQIINAEEGIFQPGDPIEIAVQIDNTGNASSPGFTITFYASMTPIITDDDIEIGSSDRPALAEGESDAFIFEAMFPDDIEDDDWFIGAIIEFMDDDEDNNIGVDDDPVRTVTDPKSELRLVKVDALGSTFAQGSSITISTTIDNIGTATSVDFPVDYYLSVNDGISTADTLIGSQDLDGLAPGEERIDSFTTTIPIDIEPGVYFVGAIVEILQDDPSNNDENDDNPITIVVPGTDIFNINTGHNGAWWGGPERNGEGVNITLVEGPDNTVVMIATIYSYDDDNNQIFLIAVGRVEGDTATLDVFITEGGLWGDDFDPALVTETQWGTGFIRASNCELMHLELIPNSTYIGLGYTELLYDLLRLGVPIAPCPAVDLGTE